MHLIKYFKMNNHICYIKWKKYDNKILIEKKNTKNK